MEFNADEFRKKAKAAGLDDKDIESEISYQTGGKKDIFAKGNEGFELSSKEDLHSRLGNDWWHLPAAGIGLSGLATAGKAVYDWYKSQSATPATRIDPTLAQEPVIEPPAKSGIELAKERLMQTREAGIGAKPPVTPSGPTYNVPTAQIPQSPVQAPVPAPAPVQPPMAAAPVEPAAPSAAQAIAAGESPSKAIQMDVANQLDKESGVTQRVRRTKAQISSELEAKMAKAPPGMLPSAPKKTNKLPGDVIGQGGWHWLSSQEGANAAAVWRDLFGDKNVKYDPVVEKYTDMMMSGGEPGRFPPSYSETRRQPYVPGHIKGSVSPGMLLNLAGNTLGAAGLLQAYKQGKETGDYSDVGLGAIGQILGNIAPKTSVGFSLMSPSETNKGEKEELAKRRKMKPTVD